MKKHQTSPRLLSRLALHSALLGLSLLGAQSGAIAQTAPAVRHDIPATSLEAALQRYARSTGINLSYDAALLAGRQSQALQGSYTPAAGLAALLAGSGLQAQAQPGGGFVLRPAVAQAAPPPATLAARPAATPARPASTPEPEPQAALPLVRVSGTADRQAQRELGYRARTQASAGFGEQALLDTPFQVSVVTAELMRDQQSRSLADVARLDASAVVGAPDTGWYDRISLRGFSIREAYRDGLRISDQAQVPLDNKAAVEFVKGLSALRYGFSTPGGVINYMVKRPTEAPLSRAGLSLNGFGGLALHTDLSRRFGVDQSLGLRLNASLEHERHEVAEQRGPRRFVSAALDWLPRPDLRVELEGEFQQRELGGNYGLGPDAFAPGVDSQALLARLDRKAYRGQSWSTYPSRTSAGSARLSFALNDNWRLQAAAQVQRIRRAQYGMWVSSESLQANGDLQLEHYISEQQLRGGEAMTMRLDGTFHTAALSHQLTLGLERTREIQFEPAVFWATLGRSNLFNPVRYPKPSFAPEQADDWDNRNITDSVFLNDTISWGSDWQLNVGLRQLRPRFENFKRDGSLKAAPFKRSAFTPSLSLAYKPAAHLSIYANYVQGLEGGGTAPTDQDIVNKGEVMPALRSHQQEIGFKAELGAGSLFSAALFNIDKGLERRSEAKRWVQDGRQVHRGVEASLSGTVRPGLRLVSSLAWLDAKTVKGEDPSIVGKRPTDVPKLQANVLADWQLPGLPGWSLNAGAFHKGSRAITADNRLSLPAYTRFDAGLRYAGPLAGVESTVRLNVQNLGDKRYFETGYAFGLPRTLLLSVDLEW
ncbi:iron complex outermembrane receptor protein [Paucibacter oligotrophus]|uniref:Iron complex outermembrane receptor protein n=1 Tax=Roseateles oligotrophus TaxID=1769250 RepID=A0A840LC52_9BURK|nr:TonB-dependent siderophore receptor [Roseateles oligotrophus]MBB4845736.1 iron complex outermembrane receptor protein [Roseateles oligotrophus]